MRKLAYGWVEGEQGNGEEEEREDETPRGRSSHVRRKQHADDQGTRFTQKNEEDERGRKEKEEEEEEKKRKEIKKN